MQTKTSSAVANAFSDAAKTYDHAAIIEHEIAQRLLAKVTNLNLDARTILDVGCATGAVCSQLQDIFPDAHIVGLDLAFEMVNFARKTHNASCVCADALHLPFKAKQFDLIFSSCCLPSINDVESFFAQMANVLSPNGVLLFATFGPDTLSELGLTNQWLDMHVHGDLLQALQYRDPVLEREKLVFSYATVRDLVADLQESGSFILEIDATLQDTPVDISIEVIYGIAWKDESRTKQMVDAAGNVLIPLTEIGYIQER